MTRYFRPLCQTGTNCPANAIPVAGGWSWFEHVEVLERGRSVEIVPINDIPDNVLHAISCPRLPIAGMSLMQPRLMGILNVTPDSFSDGGQFDQAKTAVSHAIDMEHSGADFIDIGGESTRPGAEFVPAYLELSRTEPIVKGIREISDIPISIDTRKSTVADAAIGAGANIVNDVSALSFDPDISGIVAKSNTPICLMHCQGVPETMQERTLYDNVLLDVYDYLAQRIHHAESCGISRSKIIIDPGIGFGKTTEDCIRLVQNISLFHALGCSILLGVSRKRFIGELAKEPDPMRRLPGTIALGLSGISQGVQITRVHDIAEMRQATTLWQSVTSNGNAQ